MFKYDKAKNILTIQRKELPKLETNLLSDLQVSYDKYCHQTVKADIKYFFEEVLSNEKTSYEVKCYLGNRPPMQNKATAHTEYLYYPVYVQVTEINNTTGQRAQINFDDYEVFRIPYMDEMGKLTTLTGPKVCLGLLKPSEDAAYDAEAQIYNIAMPNGNLRIKAGKNSKKYTINALGSKNAATPLLDIITGMLYDISHEQDSNGVVTELFDIHPMLPYNKFVNNIAINMMVGREFVDPENVANDKAVAGYIKKLSKSNTLLHDMYNIGEAREALNKLYDLSAAVGKYSSRDIIDVEGNVICKLNDKITEDIVIQVKKSGNNVIYVWNDIDISGYRLAENIKLTYIPKGAANSDYLRKLYPQYKQYDILPEDVYSGEVDVIDDTEYTVPVVDIPINTYMTQDLVEFLKGIGITKINCFTGDEQNTSKSQNKVLLSFEREIIGNHFARLGELRPIEAGETYNDWVYTFNNPTFRVARHDTLQDPLHYLTVHDLEAIYSDLCHILETGSSDNLLNRDDAFLKRISMIDETFSKYFRQYVDRAYSKPTSVARYIERIRKREDTSARFTRDWMKIMNKAKVIASIDSTNLMAEITQVAHANIELLEPPDPVRRLAIPYYGRICPFETPASKKLGLVNTKAVGCRIGSKGLPEVPYYKIINKGGHPAINYNKIHWLTVKDEIGNTFVDLFSLDIDDAGNIADGYALARIPNPTSSGEPFIVSRISTSELIAQDVLKGKASSSYVNVYPEQMLSPTACLIPFAASDDATRISYGLSQMKQAIYLADSEIPSVITDMYEDIFTYSDYQGMSSTIDGEVVKVTDDSVTIKDLVTNEEVVISPSNSLVLAVNNDTLLSYDSDIKLHAIPIVKVGDVVSKGDIVIDVNVYPKQFLTKSPVSGTIINITTESIIIQTEDNDPNWNKLVINPDNAPITIPYQGVRVLGNTIVVSSVCVAVGDKVNKGDVLIETNMSKDGYYTPSRDALIAYIPTGYNHEDGVMVSEKAACDYTSIICHTLTKNISPLYFNNRTVVTEDNMKYHRAGEEVARIISTVKGNSVRKYDSIYSTSKCHGIAFDAVKVKDNNDNTKAEAFLMGFNKLSEGDKMSGRHGNKGVVSRVAKNSEMPQFMNGEIPDVVLNPLGVPSRMNLGQIDDVHMGLVAHLTNTRIKSNAFNGATPEEITALVHFCYDYMTWLRDGRVSSAETLITVTNSVEEYRNAKFDPEWLTHVWHSRYYMMKWINAFNYDGTANMYDPITDTVYRTPVTFGWAYYFKLMQEAEEKICFRSGPLGEEYSRTQSQPQKNGDLSAKGQKLGEMELVALAAYGSAGVIDEVLNEKSDNLSKSFNLHAQQLQYDERVPNVYCQSRATENLIAYLMSLGINIQCTDDVHNMYEINSNSKYTYDLKHVVSNHCAPELAINKGLGGVSDSKDLLRKIKAQL